MVGRLIQRVAVGRGVHYNQFASAIALGVEIEGRKNTFGIHRGGVLSHRLGCQFPFTGAHLLQIQCRSICHLLEVADLITADSILGTENHLVRRADHIWDALEVRIRYRNLAARLLGCDITMAFADVSDRRGVNSMGESLDL